MSNNNFGYGDNYPPVSNRTQTSQASHQTFPTSNATSTPYYGLQGSEAAGKTYSGSDYQYGQYAQAGASSTNNLYNWNNYRTSTGTGADSASGLESVEQRLVNATRAAPAQSTYDSSLANLGYGSNLTYGTAAETAQPASEYAASNLYSGTTQSSAAQRNTQYEQAQTQSRPVATAQRGAHVPQSQGQRQAVDTTPRTTTTASYNLPTPSPTYPQGLINSYPGNASTAAPPRATAPATGRTTEASKAQASSQQPSYTAASSYGYNQQARAGRMSPEQMRKTQTPTPPVPPARMATPENRGNTYQSQTTYQQPAQNTQAQTARDTRARQSGHASSLKQAPVNVIMPSVGQPQTSPKRAPAGQRDMYQPQQTAVPAPQSRSAGNFRSDPSRASSMYQQQQTENRNQPTQDQPTSVDPSLVYNRYHEYQQQIKEAEAEAARLAKIEEEKKAKEEAEKRKAEAARLQKEAEAARMEKQRKQQEAKAAREAKAAEKKRKKEAADAAAAVKAAHTLAQTMSSQQPRWGVNTPQEVQAAEGDEEVEYMEVQAGDEHDQDYAGGQQAQRNLSNTYSGTPAHKPILPPGYQSTPQPRPAQQTAETPSHDDLTAMMEEEMRKTVERLRDFQAKDPKLFLKVWSSVRKSGGPDKSPQPNGEGSQAQQSPALANSGIPAQPQLSYGAGPSNAHHGNDPTAPLQLLPVPPTIPKKKPGRKPKKALEAQAQATQNQEQQIPQLQNQEQQNHEYQHPPSQNHQFVPVSTGEPLARGESVMMQTEYVPMPSHKRKPGRPKKIDKALWDLAHQNDEPAVKRKPGRPKGSKTKPKPVDGEAEEPPMERPPTPPMQPAGPGSFGRLVPRPEYVREEQARLILENAQQIAHPNPTASMILGGQQLGTPTAPRIATPVTMERPKPAAPTPAKSQTTAQWPDEHIDLIAETGSKLLNSLPQNAGKHMEASTIRDMLRTNPSYVQVCEMIEKAGFQMDRSKFARTLLSVISPSHIVPPKTQGQSAGQQSAKAGAAGQAQQSTNPGSSSSAAAAMRSHKESLAANPSEAQQSPNVRSMSSAAAAMRAHKESLAGNQSQSQPQARTSSALGSSRPFSTYKPPKYGGVESGTQPLVAGSFVGEDGAQSQSASKPTAADKGKHASQYQTLRPDESDDFVPPQIDDDDREAQQLSLLQAFNNNRPGPTSYSTPYEQAQQGTASSGNAGAHGVAQGSQMGNGVWGEQSNQFSHSTPQQRSFPIQSQIPQNGPATAPQGKPPQFSHLMPFQNAQTPSRSATPARPWNTGDAGMKRPHSEAFKPHGMLASQTGSPFVPKPWGGRINTPSDLGARAPNPFNASPFRASATTPPQPQMPTQAAQKSYQAIYTQPYLQVNTVEEFNQQQIAKNPLLSFDGIVLPIDTSIARRRSRYNPKTIARDVLISTGRHQSERSLNAHLEILKNFKTVDNQSDLSTFRWDIVDPGGDDVGSYNKELREKMAASRAGPTPSRGNPFSMSSKPKTPSALRNETIEIQDDDDAMELDDDMPRAAQSVARSKDGTPGHRLGRQARNPAPNYKGMTAAELKGLKHDAGRRIREDSEQTPSEAARNPREGKRYVEFACKWEGCNKVLLNLDTLKRHIFTMHGQNDDVVQPGKVCMWHGCGNNDYSAENAETPGTYFDKLKDFKMHMQDTHLKSVARLYGDGPKSDVHDGDSDSVATTSYLFDSDGRQVTPSTAGQDIERGNAIHLAEARHRKYKREVNRKDAILDYWNIKDFEHQPVKLDARKSTGGLSKECLGRWVRMQRRMGEVYGDELERAAKEGEGMGERGRKRVWRRDMPKEMRKKLGV